MNRAAKLIAWLLLVVVGNFLYWRLSYSLGIPLLLFVVSLAIVGKGNRLIWTAVFPFLCVILAGITYATYGLFPPEAEIIKLFLAFVLLSVIPGLVLWFAVKMKATRDPRDEIKRSASH